MSCLSDLRSVTDSLAIQPAIFGAYSASTFVEDTVLRAPSPTPSRNLLVCLQDTCIALCPPSSEKTSSSVITRLHNLADDPRLALLRTFVISASGSRLCVSDETKYFEALSRLKSQLGRWEARGISETTMDGDY
jgi:hypothetical protein